MAGCSKFDDPDHSAGLPEDGGFKKGSGTVVRSTLRAVPATVPDPFLNQTRGQRNLFAWAFLAGLILLAALAGPFWAGRIYTHDDLGAFHLPVRAFYAEQLARSEPFDWTPGLFAGFYLSGEGQAGTYHPMHLLLYRFLPLSSALALEVLLSYPVMLAGTYFFLKRRLGRRDAAMFGSLVFTFSGFNLLHFVHPNAIAVVSHVPWLLWAIDLRMTDSSARKAAGAEAGIAFLTGSQLLLGYPQYVWFSLLAEACYVAWVAGEPGARRFRSVWRRLAFAKAAGLMLGAVQLLPTIDALAHSARHSADAAFSALGSLHALNLTQLIAPYLFTDRVLVGNTHEYGLYIGAVPLVLLVWLRTEWDQLGRLRRLSAAVAGFGAIAFWLALGEGGQLYRLQQLLPLVGNFRCPCRYIVLCHLATSVLAAIAMMRLVRRMERGQESSALRLRPLWITVAVSAVVAAFGLIFRNHPYIASPIAILAGPLLISVAAILVSWAARGSRPALVGLILFAALDLGVYGLSYAVYPHTARPHRYMASITLPPAGSGGRVMADLIRFDEIKPHTGNQMTMAGWHRLNGYAGLEPARQLDYGQLAALRVAGVRWVKKGQTTAEITGLVEHDDRWLEVPGPLGRVRLVTRVRPSQNPAADIQKIPLESTVLVERPLDLPAGIPGTARIVSDRPGRLHVRTRCPTEQLMVVSESYHNGWRVEVDGRPGTVLRVNGDFMACVVPPGEHQVRLEFQPWSRRWGMVLSCLGLTIVLVSAMNHLIRPTRSPSGRPLGNSQGVTHQPEATARDGAGHLAGASG